MKSKKWLFFFVAVFGFTLILFPFTDVPVYHWAYKSVVYLEKKDVLPVKDKYFEGNKPVQRKFVFLLLANLFWKNQNLSSQEKLNKLQAEGLVKGIPGKGLTLANYLKRYELAVLLERIIKKRKLTYPVDGISVYFKDIPPNHWAKEAVYFCVKRGVLKGYPDRTFRGNNKVTRYEVAVLFARLFLLKSKVYPSRLTVEEAKRYLSLDLKAKLIEICEGIRRKKRKYVIGRWDCSLFTQAVFKKLGIYLPRTTKGQSRKGIKVSYSQLKAGDLVFFDFRHKYPYSPSHVGIYVGNYQGIKHAFFHNSTKAKRVVLADLSKRWARSKFLYGVRLKIKRK